jgi:predicted Zn-dependent protease
MIVRAALILLSAAAIAWLAAGIQASNAQDDLGRLVATTAEPDRADLARANELRKEAERYVPGRRPSLLEATIRARTDPAGAGRLLNDVVADEPDNAEAWLLLAQATEQSDPQRSEQAMARVRELAPNVPAP